MKTYLPPVTPIVKSVLCGFGARVNFLLRTDSLYGAEGQGREEGSGRKSYSVCWNMPFSDGVIVQGLSS